ncbi:hypothetical protein C474_12015 [Halogeometricum pallidum JCM 14848]|uniref:Halobacterial output domain-containing protein n=1 Tax=Halogeometricum pallidum JCM 14848 TaxID=1227487 RepID=M0D5Y3_HALPD|nr:HalOD1 output domain-containing protein [Halogeometricum pallidum]ELZ30087.1 hypothetical protein C474_12015 [Halogeometricum pallidum JCM 14848]
MDETPDDAIIQRQLQTNAEEPAVEVAKIVAELEGTAADQLGPTYVQIDHMLDHLFSNPPAPEAQVEVTFTYEGYRITVSQSGRAQFVKV